MSLYEVLRRAVPEQLAAYLLKQRWFGGKARQIRSTELIDLVPVQAGPVEAFVLLARVEYDSGPGDTYVVPLISASASSDQSGGQSADQPADGHAVFNIRRQDDDTRGAILTDALQSERFLSGLLEAIEAKLTFTGTRGEIFAASTDVFQGVRAGSRDALRPRVLKGEQSNSSIAYGDRFILKLFRRVEEGVNPDLEIGRFLTEKTRFANVAPVTGSLEYRAEGGGLMTLGILQRFVPNEGDAWRFTLKSLETFWEQAAKRSTQPEAAANPISLYDSVLPPLASELIGLYFEKVELLGKRTAQLHLALASNPSAPAFAPEAFTPSFQREMANAARELAVRNLALLRQKAGDLPAGTSGLATEVLGREMDILEKFDARATASARGARIRIHGDYHLGQVLYTGSDFVIIDFEGEPARPLAERRAKRSALQDVASMVRSFHYAAFAHLLGGAGDSATSAVNAAMDRVENPAAWAENWYGWAASRFLASYFEAAQSGSFLPPSREEISGVLQMHLLEKAVYELGYELNNRPSWAGIPLAGISQLLARRL